MVNELASATEGLVARTVPSNEIPTTVAIDVILARTNDVVIAFNGARAYSRGIELFFSLHARRPELVSAIGAFGSHFAASDESVLIGVEFADGRTATTLWDSAELGPHMPMLTNGRSGGGPAHSSASYYLTPVPPAGSLSMVVCWPLAGIGESQVDLDSKPFRAAVGRAQVLWPEQPELSWEPPQPVYPNLEPGGWFARTLARP